MVLLRQHLGRYAGLCHLLDQPAVVSSGLPMPASPGFTRVFCGRRRVCGLLICWDKEASPSTTLQFALAISLTETYLGLDAIKSGFGAGSVVKVPGIGCLIGLP